MKNFFRFIQSSPPAKVLVVDGRIELGSGDPPKAPAKFVEFVRAHPDFSGLTPDSIEIFQTAAQRLMVDRRAVGTVQVFESR